jgi:hypothetical protein
MKKIIKVVLWICGIVGLIFIGLIGWGVYIASDENLAVSHQEALNFAESHTKEECLGELTKRLSQCDSGMCLKELNFGPGCLVNADGSKEQFCIDKPTSDENYSEGTWFNHCSVNKLDKHKCEMVYKVFSAYCRNEY